MSTLALMTRLERLFQKLLVEDSSNFFKQPVDYVALGLPDYPTIVQRPMDLGTVSAKQGRGEYESMQSMADDILLTFDNAILYNPSEDFVATEAKRIKSYFLKHYESLRAELEAKEGKKGGGAHRQSEKGGEEKGSSANAPAAKPAHASSKAASSAKAASPAAAKPSTPKEEWSVPSVSITDATRPHFIKLLNELNNESVSELFRQAVPPSEQAYHAMIQRPMHLQEIKRLLFAKEMTSAADMDKAIELIHSNAVQYNSGTDRSATSIRKDAGKLRKMWRSKMKALAAKVAANGGNADADADQTDSEDELPVGAAAGKKGVGGGKAGKKGSKAAASPAPNGASAVSSGETGHRAELRSLFNSFFKQLSVQTLSFFQWPVSKERYPDYYAHISRPLALEDVRENLEKGLYDKKAESFLADMALIWSNACSYNEDGSPVHTSAQQSRARWEKVLAEKATKELREMERAMTKGAAGSGNSNKGANAAGAEKEKADNGGSAAGSSSNKKKKETTKSSATAAAASSPATTAAASSSAAAAAPAASAASIAVVSVGPAQTNKCRHVLNKVKTNHLHMYEPFSAPVTDSIAPNYSQRISKPMCFQWVWEKLNRDHYQSNQDFSDDVEQIFKNCLTYNGPDNPLTKHADTLKRSFRKLFREEFGVSTRVSQEEHAEQKKREVAAQLAAQRKELEETMRALQGGGTAEAEVKAKAKEENPTAKANDPTSPMAPKAKATLSPAPASAAAAAPLVLPKLKLEAPHAPKHAPAATQAAPAHMNDDPNAKVEQPPAVSGKMEAHPPAHATAAPTPPAAAAAAAAASPSPAVPSASPSPAHPTASASPMRDFSSVYHAIHPDPSFYTPSLVSSLAAQPLDAPVARSHFLRKLVSADKQEDFKKPVVITPDIADYVTKIRRPMDLGTLGKNVTAGLYPTFKEFLDDAELIWSNCIQFNGPSHVVAQAAADLRSFSHTLVTPMLAAAKENETLKGKLPEVLRAKAQRIVTELLKFTPYAHTFLHPIEPAPEKLAAFQSVVAQPAISLDTVQRKLNGNEYHTLAEFYKDMRRVFRSCIAFYSLPQMSVPEKIYTLQAQFLLNEFEIRVAELEARTAGAAVAGNKAKGAKAKGTPIALSSAAAPGMLRKSTTGGSVGTAVEGADGGGCDTMATDVGEGNGVPTLGGSIFPFPAFPIQGEELKKADVVLDALLSDPRWDIFTRPVDPSMYEGFLAYYEHIDRPMDLSLVRRKLKIGLYALLEEFKADIQRISANVLKFYGEVNSNFKDGPMLMEQGRALAAQLDAAWNLYQAGFNGKKLAAHATIFLAGGAQTPAATHSAVPMAAAGAATLAVRNNLAPPTLASQSSVAPLPIAATPPVSLAAAPPAPSAAPSVKVEPPPSASAVPLTAVSAPSVVVPAPSLSASVSSKLVSKRDETPEERAARKEAKRLKKERKEEKRKRKMEEALAGGRGGSAEGRTEEVDVMRMSPPHSPGQPAAEMSSSPQPRAKIPRLSAAPGVHGTATLDLSAASSSPRKLVVGPSPSSAVSAAGVPTLLPGVKAVKIKTATGVSAPLLDLREEQPRVHVGMMQRKRLMAMAAAKQAALWPLPNAMGPPPQPGTNVAASAAQPQAMEIDADTSTLPDSIPGSSASVLPGALAASAFASHVPPPPLQRTVSHLTPLQQLGKAEKAKKGKDAKAKKRLKAMLALFKTYEEHAAAQMAKRAALLPHALTTGLARAAQQHVHVLPLRVPAEVAPLYRSHDFFPLEDDVSADSSTMDVDLSVLSGVLVRVVQTSLPPTSFFPFPIDQHVLLFVQDSSHESTNVSVQLQLSHDASLQLSESGATQQGEIFQRWIQLKAAVDETRKAQLYSRHDLQMLGDPLTSSSSLLSDLSFFASLAPSLHWHANVSCYTHAFELSGADGNAGPAGSMMSDSGKWPNDSSVDMPISFERMLELSMQGEDSSDEEHQHSDEDAEAQGRHARPFTGVRSESCTMNGCICTPLADGKRFFHRCAAREKHTPWIDAADSSTLAAASPPPSTLPCRGLLVWSLPGSLSLRVGGREWCPAPFESRVGVWRARVVTEAERVRRLEAMRKRSEQAAEALQRQRAMLAKLRDA